MAIAFPLIIRDPVHGNMRFTALEKAIIDSPFFQRLRGLKQSSLAYYTYPTALTSRFEHSLGAAHVAGLIVEHVFASGADTTTKQLLRLIERDYKSELAGIPKKDHADLVLCAVRLASLLHDVGHLPFSHCFEDEFQSFMGESAKRWGQEEHAEFKTLRESLKAADASYTLKLHEYISYLIASRHKDILEVVDSAKSRFIHTMALDILIPTRRRSDSDHYLYTVLGRVVHGEIDADRMDFIRRDAGMTGSGLAAFTTDRLIECLTLADVNGKLELLPTVRGISVLEGFFTSRLEIYRWQYHHHNVIYYDLLLKWVVRQCLNGALADVLEVDLVEQLSADAFLERDPQPTKSARWFIRDDGQVWSLLMEIHSRLAAQRPTIGQKPLRDRMLVALEELLFRRKRHVALWKDAVGFAEFQRVLWDSFVDALRKEGRRSVAEAERYVREFARDLEHGEDHEERICAHFVDVVSKERHLDSLQSWLEAHGTTDIMLDYRAVQPFRRLTSSDLSAIRVCGRDPSGHETYPLTQLSDILDGMRGRRFQQTRLFGYVLLSHSQRLSAERHGPAFVENARVRLAKEMVKWGLSDSAVFNNEARRRLGLEPHRTSTAFVRKKLKRSHARTKVVRGRAK